MAGEPAFFELGVQDDDKGRAFYADLVGWDFLRPPPAPVAERAERRGRRR